MALNVLLLGAQGAGKGTQAGRVAAEYGVPHISTGDMLREAVAAGTPLGERVRPIMEAGRLCPDELMIELIEERLGRGDTAEGFVLDGFPRSLAQAEALDDMLAKIGRPLTVVFELQIPEAVAVERMLGRARAEGRADDTPEAIAKRLELYRQVSEPVVERYRMTGNLVGIHAARTVNEVWAELQEALEHLAVR